MTKKSVKEVWTYARKAIGGIDEKSILYSF